MRCKCRQQKKPAKETNLGEASMRQFTIAAAAVAIAAVFSAAPASAERINGGPASTEWPMLAGEKPLLPE
jgi:hypothetical protein